MSDTSFTESVVEQAALAWLDSMGWSVRHGPEIAPGEPASERGDYGQVVLEQRLCDALARLNPGLPAETLEDAFRKLTRPDLPAAPAAGAAQAGGAELVARNRGRASPACGRRDGRVQRYDYRGQVRFVYDILGLCPATREFTSMEYPCTSCNAATTASRASSGKKTT